MPVHPVLIDGVWRASSGAKTFQAVNPATKDQFPVSPWNEIELAVLAASRSLRLTLRFANPSEVPLAFDVRVFSDPLDE